MIENIIREKILRDGAMPFGEFMALALGHPEYGYYATRDPFGVDGDFTTAPEISQMFGEMVGAWVVDIWMQMGQPKSFNLIECGAGRGTLMADILRIAQAVDGFCDAVQVHLVETSCTLREVQQKALRGFDVVWHDSLDIGFVDKPCIILGNEFLDALPIEQIRFMNNEWQQKYVTVDKNSPDFGFEWLRAKKECVELAPETKSNASVYEIAPERNRFMRLCINMLKKNGGAALFIDYGYTAPNKGDTIQAVREHKYTDALKDVGQADITAHVDFTSLVDLANEAGCIAPPPISQGDFLKSLGIEYRAKALQAAAVHKYGAEQGHEKALGVEKDLHRLIGEKEMGTLFKAMCVYHGYDLKPAGF